MRFPVDAHTPCYGKHDLFDSRLQADHLEAKKLCARCPLRGTACNDLLAQTLADYPISGPQGTWAGKHISPRTRPVGRPRKESAA